MNIITVPEGVCAGLVETVLDVPVRLRGDAVVSTATQDQVDAAAAALLAAARTARIEALTQACATVIVGGFTSDALGHAHRYPSAVTDQANLVQAAACADGGPLWCADGDLAWSFAAHTRDQAAQVLTAFVATRTALQTRLAALTAAVDAAEDTAAVAAVTWGTDDDAPIEDTPIEDIEDL